MFGFNNNTGWEFSKAKLCIVLVSSDFYAQMLLNFALYYCHLITEVQKSGSRITVLAFELANHIYDCQYCF